jgi:DNA-binding YbaB/EbfC family protein
VLKHTLHFFLGMMIMFKLGNLAGMMGQFKDIQANMAKMQEELERRSIEASSGGGMVTATVNGKGDLLNIKIEPDTMASNDVEMIEDLVKAAVNAAVAKSRDAMKDEMGKLTGGMDIPGMEGLAGMLK